MTISEATHGLQLRSLVKSSGELELSLRRVAIAEPADDEVIIRVEATPINPSDLGLLFAAADLTTAAASGSADDPIVTATIPEGAMRAMKGRLDDSMLVGNEGAGVVVRAGASPAAQSLLGKTVATFGGGMYVQYRCAKAAQCVPLPPDCSAAEGAAIFVNPLTALCMVDVMRREGHTALVHTAAASNLGQMLQRLCLKEKIGLVNIVRNEAQADILRKLGATHVCNSTAPSFMNDLIQALVATGATLAFDAIGGGALVSQILTGMEAAITQSAKTYSRYGSATHKQVYIYGMLDTGPTILKRSFGPAFGIGGWLLTNYLQKVGADSTAQLQARVLAELKTTFACQYTREVSLAEALQLEHIAAYSQRTTGGKYLINPAKH
jgi:NADPH:quinone reductase-like Zn-dependent oxidoreductase